MWTWFNSAETVVLMLTVQQLNKWNWNYRL